MEDKITTAEGRQKLTKQEKVLSLFKFIEELRQHRINAKNRIIQWVPNKNCE